MGQHSHIFLMEPDTYHAEKIAGLLSGMRTIESVTILTRSDNLVPMVCKCRPGFVLMSIQKAQYSRHLISAIQTGSPQTRIFIYVDNNADYESQYARAAARLGAHGVLNLDTLQQDILSALEQNPDQRTG